MQEKPPSPLSLHAHFLLPTPICCPMSHPMLSHFYPGDKGYKPMLLQNVGNHLQQYMLSQPRKLQSTCSPDEISSSQGDQYEDGCLFGMLLHVVF